MANEEDDPAVKPVSEPVYALFARMENLKYYAARDQTEVVAVEERVLKGNLSVTESLDVSFEHTIRVTVVILCPGSDAAPSKVISNRRMCQIERLLAGFEAGLSQN